MPLNIPTKNTGDQLTASEFNELVNEAKNIETKLSGLSNYDDTALKNRIVAVESKIDSIAGSVVSFSESEVGTLKYAGKDYTIYERMVEITGLPSVAGESSEHVISDDPLGNNLYISVKDLIVKDSNGVYLPSNYTISKIHVTENFNTTLTMICDKGIATSATALVTLVYIKFEIEKIEFKIGNIDTIVNKENIKLSFPNLKYGKKFAYSFIFDDTTVKSNKAFFTINKKWIDNESFQHLNQTRTTGTIPAKTLGYTDGFGIEKRFTYGVAIWPGFGNQYIDNYLDPSQNPGKNYPYLVWSEVKTLTEFGNEFHFHDVKATDQKNVNEVLEGMKAAQKATIEKIGTGLKVMVRPNGNDTYVDAAMLFDDVVMSTTEGGQGIKYVINNDTDLKKGLIWRRNCDSLDSAGILSKIAEISTVDGTWWCDFSHSANQELLTAMAEINDTYGKEGNDSIWFASVDEVYEYWLVKKMSKFRIAILSDSEIKVTMFIPKISNGRHPDFTLHVSGLVGDNETISPLSDNIVGLNHGKINDVFSLNLNANVNLLNIVEKYTSKYEGLSLDEDKEDALYMVSQLRADLQTPFLARINAGDIAPILNSISLNSGATTTYEVAVSVLLNVTGNISHYRISESADLSAVAWIEGSSKTIKFNLSSSLGTKTVHVQVKTVSGNRRLKHHQ